MRWVWILAAAAASAACDRGTEYSIRDARYDPSQLTSSGGEVALSDGSNFDIVITSDRYKQWDAARQGLSRNVASRFGALLQPRSPSERSINRAVAYLEQEPQARSSIERTGMSVRDFVHMTVALEQQMVLASTAGPRPPEPIPMPLTYDPTLDSAYAAMPPTPPPGYAPPPVYVPPTYVPPPSTALPPPTDYRSPRYSTRPDSQPRPDSVGRPLPPPRDTVRMPRDTMPRRDTLQPKRDTASPKPPPRDTVRDTVRLSPPDSIPAA
jgi:hypothetical protein